MNEVDSFVSNATTDHRTEHTESGSDLFFIGIKPPFYISFCLMLSTVEIQPVSADDNAQNKNSGKIALWFTDRKIMKNCLANERRKNIRPLLVSLDVYTKRLSVGLNTCFESVHE